MRDRLKKLSPQFKKILKISAFLADSCGFRVYLVGGVIRDLLLGKPVFDLDMVVEGDAIVLAHKLAKHLRSDIKRHHNFGTATVLFKGHKIDFATARSEEYPHWGSLPRVKPDVLTRDLFRRDFTINAMAIGLNKGDKNKLIDIYGGLNDLKSGIIRVLHPKSFLEDPTRMFRAIRFEQRFDFVIEPYTFKLLKEAAGSKALSSVSQHRLRDEMTLILQEDKPCRYIKRVKDVLGFMFLDKKLRVDKKSFLLFSRIEKAVFRYRKQFKYHRDIKSWLIYLTGILMPLSSKRISGLLHDFAFKKGERAVVTSIKNDIRRIMSISKTAKPRIIYRILKPYSFEAIVFFYAYYTDRNLRRNIEHFLEKLVFAKLKMKGEDLKKIGFHPHTLYGDLLQSVLYAKIEKGLRHKRDELKEAKIIFTRLRTQKKYKR